MTKTFGSIFLLIFLSIQLQAQETQVLDDIVPRTTLQERTVLSYPSLREADIFWEKRIWRVINTREKMNLPFVYPEAPLFNIIRKAAEEGDITLYSAEDDSFQFPLDSTDLNGLVYSIDTIPVTDLETGEYSYKVVSNQMNFEDVKRFRVKEVWFFDEATASLKVRILGIAPLVEVFDDNGNFRYEKPMFWVYYPQAREILSKQKVFNSQNDAALTSWEDLFEMRFFASTIYKQSNVHNNRIEDYLSGIDQLLEADKISNEIFNFEHDLWSY